MATKELTRKESVNVVINNAKKQIERANNAQADIKSASHNLQYWIRSIKALSKKNEFCNGKNVKSVENSLPYGFSIKYFYKDFSGRWCVAKSYKGSITLDAVKDAQIHGETITDKGNELILSEDNSTIIVLRPLVMKLETVFSAFADIVKTTAKAEIKVEKQRIKDAKDAQKTLNKAQRDAQKELSQAVKDLAAKVISFEEFTAISNKAHNILLYAC